MTEEKGQMLSEAIEQMKTAIRNRDLSSKYLKKNGCETRKNSFCGEWVYGITMVPSTFALQIAERLLKAEGDQFIPYEHEDNE